MAGGPRPLGDPAAIAPAPKENFWYALDYPAEISCPAFVLDTRSERERPRNGLRAQLMSCDQMQAFKAWLLKYRQDRRPKFVFLGSPIIPLTREYSHPGDWMRQDGPTGYRDELREIVRYIAAEPPIHRVIFVGGDPHLSCVARLVLTYGPQRIEAWHIVSSGLYSPLPFANLAPSAADWFDQVHKPGNIDLGNAHICYEQYLPVSGPPHFLHVSAVPDDDAWTSGVIGVQAYGKAGNKLKKWTFRLEPLPSLPSGLPKQQTAAASVLLPD
jgi:cholesterol oxidase